MTPSGPTMGPTHVMIVFFALWKLRSHPSPASPNISASSSLLTNISNPPTHVKPHSTCSRVQLTTTKKLHPLRVTPSRSQSLPYPDVNILLLLDRENTVHMFAVPEPHSSLRTSNVQLHLCARARGRAYVMSTKCLQGSALCRVPEAVDREAAVELPLLVDLGDRAHLLVSSFLGLKLMQVACVPARSSDFDLRLCSPSIASLPTKFLSA